jgi:P27 family predicted phage terminase small subunit
LCFWSYVVCNELELTVMAKRLTASGRGGRPRKPAALHELHGTLEPSRHKGWLERDGRFRALPVGEPPAGLTADQTCIWYEVMAQAPPGLLRATDSRLLASFCVLADHLNKCNERWNASGEQMDVQGRGGRVLNPLVLGVIKTSMALLKIQAELGLTPSSRTRVDFSEPMKLVEQSPDDELFD